MLLLCALVLGGQQAVSVVHNGAPRAARLVPPSLAPLNEVLAVEGVGTFVYADARLGDGDWRVEATLSLQKFDGTAASVVFDSTDHLGLDGRDGVFVEGPSFTGEGRGPEFLKDSPKLLAGRDFVVVCEKKDGMLSLSVNGTVLRVYSDAPNFRTVALRPHRAAMGVRHFLITGDVRRGLASPDLRLVNVFTSGDGRYDTYRIPSLTAAPNGDLLAFCEGRRQGPGDSGDIDVLLRRSKDGGETWLPAQVVWDDGPNTCGNPCVLVERETGTVFLFMTRNLGTDTEPQIIAGTSQETRTVWLSKSTDNGVTWSDPVELTASVKRPDWTWYATGPGAGIQIERGAHKGRLVVPCDHIEAGTKKYYSHVIYSDDKGETWRIGGSTPNDQTNECELVELTGGRLMLNSRNYDRSKRTRQVSLSYDGGATWIGQRHDEQLPEPICQASIRRWFWPEDGVTINGAKLGYIVFSNPASIYARRRMAVKVSPTDGHHWPVELVVYEGPAAYSCLALLASGQMGLLFEADEYARIAFVKLDFHGMGP